MGERKYIGSFQAVAKVSIWVKPKMTLKANCGASLMAQGSRICLPMQETQVWPLNLPDLGRSYMLQSNSACAPQLLSLWSRAHEATTTEAHAPLSLCSTTWGATTMRSLHTATQSHPRCPQVEKSLGCSNEDQAQATINKV